MLKTCCIVVLFLLLASLFSVAQKFTAEISPVFKGVPAESVVQQGNHFIMLEETDNKMQLGYTMKLNKIKFGIKLKLYDAGMNLVKENHLFAGERQFGPFPSQLRIINDKPYIIAFQMTNGGEGAIKIVAMEIDPGSLEVVGTKDLLAIDQGNYGIFKIMKLFEEYKYIVTTSPDHSALLVFWASGMNNQYFISVSDKELNPVLNKKWIVKAAEKITTNDARVDNKGNVYIAYTCDAGKNDFHGYLAIHNGKANKEIEIKTKTGYPYQLQVVPSINEDMVQVAGTYTDKPFRLKGVFSQSFSGAGFKKGKMLSTEFSPELIARLKKEGWASVKEKNYGLEPIIFKAGALSDGNLAMIGQFKRNTQTASGRNFRSSGSLVHVLIKQEKATIGMVPKYRVSAGSDIGDSYYAVPYNDKLLVFYNDNEDNLAKDITQESNVSNNYRSSILAVCYMNADGTITREKVIDQSAEYFLPVGEAMIRLTSNSFLVPLRKIKALGGADKESKWAVLKVE